MRSINNCLAVTIGLGYCGFSVGYSFGPLEEASFLFMDPHCLDTATHLNTEAGRLGWFG